MNASPEVLEELRAIRGTLAQHTKELRALTARLETHERSLLRNDSDNGENMERIDSLAERVARIERRLGLSDQ